MIGEAKMTKHSEIFGAFVEAQRALDELPEAKQRIENLESNLNDVHEKLTDRDSTIATQNETIDRLMAQLGEALKQRDDATFRELEARDQLESVVKVIRGAVVATNTAEEFLNPPKPVEPEPTSEVSWRMTNSGDEGQSDVDPTSATSLVYAQDGLLNPAPTVSSVIDTDVNTSPSDVGQTDPTLSSYSSEQESNGSGQSDGPFVSSEAEQPATVPSPSTDDTAERTAAASPPRPYENMHYWLKPSHMTWKEWGDKGGDIPKWVNNDFMLSAS